MFKNKVIWVTGASSGIGEALVKLFAKEDAKIVLSARNSDELARVQKDNNLGDKNSLVLSFDLNDAAAKADELVAQVIDKFGKIDVLVNNGGYSQRAEAKDTDMKTARELMEVNYFAPVTLTKAVLPHLLAQKSGSIIVISSIAGKYGFFLRSSYSAAKHALHGYFESFRLETEKQGIKTLIVCPGKIKTKISIKAVGPFGKTHNKMDESLLNAMDAEECAGKILFALKENKEEILIGGRELKTVWLKRHFPKWFGRIIRKQNPL